MIKKELPGESLNASLTFFQESVPYNLEAEQSLLGALLLDNTLLEKVSEFLKADHFADAFHGHLFGAICRLVERGQIADPITLKDYFAQEKALEAVGGVKYLLDLTQGVLSFTSLEDYGRLIHDLYLRREILRIAREMGEKARVYQLDESAFTHIESAEKELFDLATKGQRQGGFIPFSDALSQALSSTEQAFKKDSHIVGVTSGLLDLDRHLGGFHPSDLLIIAGRPAMGKTSLATNIAFNAANTLLSKKSNGASVAFFSLEMSAEQLAGRILASEAGISSDKMRRGEISTTDFPRFVEVSRRLNQLPLYIDDTPALSVQALRNRARRLQRQQGLDLIIIDYLQLLESGKGGKGDNRVHEISDISRSLKAIAKELSVPVIALSQLSRAVEQRDDKRPQLSDLRESGSIEQDADVVMFVFRPEYYLQRKAPVEGSDHYAEKYAQWQHQMHEVYQKAEVIIAKQRHGPVGTVHLFFDGHLTKFDNLAQEDRYPAAPSYQGKTSQ